MSQIDLFIISGEPSGDLHGEKLIQELLTIYPQLKIGAVAGPKMRTHPIQSFFPMESLQVMGFIDVLFALPKITKQFFAIRRKILELSPKAVVLIDYPGFNLRLENTLRKKGYKGKLIHLISPTVWAWGKKRIPLMEKNLDLLLTIFPFEKESFSHTKLPVYYIGHPLTKPIASFKPTHKFKGEKILAIFPGSRKAEIEKNLPLQLKVARKLRKLDPTLTLAISISHQGLIPNVKDAILIKPEDHYELMKAAHMAIATSGTVTLELALHKTPTIVNYAIAPLDCFLAQKIFKINLPFYCIANIVVSKRVFPELFGPNLTEENLFSSVKKMWFDEKARLQCINLCEEVSNSLGNTDGSKEAAEKILSLLFNISNQATLPKP